MRATCTIVALCLIICGCAASTDRQSLGYGDYVSYSCDQLGEEAVRLMRETANRSEHLIEDDVLRHAGLHLHPYLEIGC